jgi:hypothetical protein
MGLADAAHPFDIGVVELAFEDAKPVGGLGAPCPRDVGLAAEQLDQLGVVADVVIEFAKDTLDVLFQDWPELAKRVACRGVDFQELQALGFVCRVRVRPETLSGVA